MERRQFITGLISFVAAPAIVRVGSIMPIKVVQPHLYLTISMITRAAIELFVNSNAFIKNIDQQYDEAFGAKIGSQLRIRLPNDYRMR